MSSQNVTGRKLKKTVFYSDSIKIVDYLDGFQYAGGVLQFFPNPEGYVKATPMDRLNRNYAFNYVYNYTDHLGNIRVSYTKDPQTNQLKILEENHYYPFGLKHSVYPDSADLQSVPVIPDSADLQPRWRGFAIRACNTPTIIKKFYLS